MIQIIIKLICLLNSSILYETILVNYMFSFSCIYFKTLNSELFNDNKEIFTIQLLGKVN
jgi:hypothetical protein